MVKTLGRILAFIGKPFFWILSHLVLVVIFILFLIGRATRLGTSKIARYIGKRRRFRLKLSNLSIFLLFLLFTFYFLVLRGLPSPRELTTRQIEVSTKIYDRNGELLYKIYKDENRTIIKLDQIPPHVKLAILAAEDAEFYSHPGFSVRGIFRAFKQNLRSDSVQGGSTITQQLVKNALLSPERTLLRKLKEIILSIRTELVFTKDQILEMYLNEVPFGGTAYGIEEASRQYFGKSVKEISLAEAALLAGLPQSPTKYSPFGQNPELAFERRKEVLHLMKVNKFITQKQEEEALNQRITLVPNRTQIKAPHFVMYVKQLLVDIYGEELIQKGGLEVTTTLDLPTQELAESIVKNEIDKLKNLNVGNGAVVVTNPQTGEILAMVGSKDYFDLKNDGNVNVVIRSRQPGSSIKVVNYAYALSHGFSPSTILDDSPVTFVVPNQPPYSPKNYDGQFRGKIPLRIALAESRNIPAVKILASYGVGKMIDLGQKMGITTWNDPSRFGLSLTLGGGEVKLIDLAKVYGTVANYGKSKDLNPILGIKDYKGKEIWPARNAFSIADAGGESVLDPRVAYMLIDILKDNHARSGEFGLSSYLVIKNHPEVAVKTGTSNDLRDNLAIGFNQNYLVAVWVGNNNNSPMSRIASGVTGASPIWNKIMSAILNGKDSIDWKAPEGLIKVNCPSKSEWFLEEDQNKTKYCLPIPSPVPVSGPQIL